MGYGLLGIGSICSLIGLVWVIVIAFQNGDTVWGVVSIFCGLAAFIYGIMHFQQAKTPMIIWIVGILLAGTANFMMPAIQIPAGP